VKVFQEQGISAVGVDGDRVNKDLLYIDEKYFITKNLSTFHDFEKKFDLAVSLEVAEHIPANAAEKFIQTLISCADYILFSAAIP
jgi:cyclopropane fatty-acyl-phospholipid synthase-like methyltransferase